MAAIARQLRQIVRTRDPFLASWYAARDGAADATVLFWGDSNFAGYSDPKNLSIPSQLAGLMTKGNPSLASFIADNNEPSFSTYDPRITVGSGWAINRDFPSALSGGFWLSNGGAGTLDFNPGAVDFDIIDAFYGAYSGGPTLALTRDGGTAVGSLTMGLGINNTMLQSLSVPLGTHTLSLSGATSGGYLSGYRLRKSTEKRTHFMNAGYYGVTSGGQTDTSVFNAIATALVISPSLVVIMLGTNDIEAAVTIPTYLANMGIIIGAMRAVGCPVLVVGPQYGKTTTYGSEAAQDAYFNPLATVASNLGCSYFSIRSISGFRTYAEAVTSGFMNADGVHLTALGRSVIAFALKQILDI